MARPQQPGLAWPEDHDVIRFVPRTQPDAKGRQHFYALFWRDGRREALSHVAGLDEHVRRARSEGATVEVVELGSDEKAAA